MVQPDTAYHHFYYSDTTVKIITVLAAWLREESFSIAVLNFTSLRVLVVDPMEESAWQSVTSCFVLLR